MSTKSNQVILTWEDVLVLVTERTPTHYQDTTALTPESRLIARDAIMLWYLVTWDSLLPSGCPLTKGTTVRWLNAIQPVPLREMVDSLKLGGHLLVTEDFPDYDAFKQRLRESYPFIGAIIAPMKKEIDNWCRNSDTDSLNLCYTWFLFLTRLNLPGLTSLEEEALNNYLSIERDLKEDGFTSDESLVLEDWFPRSLQDMAHLVSEHNPQHGPGATADAGRVQQQKYACLGLTPRLAMLHARVYRKENPFPRSPLIYEELVSKTIFVPKSLGSYRTISMESASTMWHQKGVRNALLSLIRVRRHYLRRRFDPEHQQPNRDLAWIGSLDGSFSTIDLSSASDTVSWALVKKWFFNTSLYPWLLWTRSTHTLLPNGQKIKLRKYAPMGSDLCFPVETIIFAAIVECAIREYGDDPLLSEYRVYGDDIVVEDRYVPLVLSRLIQNGFIPNEGKTFSGRQPRGFFRESCGGFFFNGVDITPIRISRRFDGFSKLGTDTAGRIESLIELANDCYSRYPSVRRWCVHQLLKMPRHLRPPFSSDGDVGLFSLQPTNFHLESGESSSLQTAVYTYGATWTPKRERQEKWEDIRLYEYLRQADGRQRLVWPEDRIDVDVSPIQKSSWYSKKSSLY